MEYQKYLKYKTKYLQLKAKLTQLGGADRWFVDPKSEKREITETESYYIQQQYATGNPNEFSIPTDKYRYQLNIGAGTGVRISKPPGGIEVKTGIFKLATVEEFVFKQSLDFIKALREIQAGRKTSHWIWWILPSDIGESLNAVKYALGPNATERGSISINTYLKNDTLRRNYLNIIKAIYEHLKKNMSKNLITILEELLSSKIDYAKFKNSFNNFYPELKKVVDAETKIWLDDLHEILYPKVRQATSLSASAASLPPGYSMPSPGGRAMDSREFQEYGEPPSSQQKEPTSRPVPSVDLRQAQDIIRKYVVRFKANVLTINDDELAEIKAAKNTIEREEKDEEKKTAVKYLYEFAEQFNKLNYSVNDWFNHTLKVLSNY